ncbi:MAG: electron transfer flavoprotein subunit beta [Actinobacteria bacterium]|nr:electron transfer flavoprotein subunit beta [Actinomycetota bacterium]MCG2801622.1 electron transfer flavoprotein subunit beta [Cellulomonas sp.]
MKIVVAVKHVPDVQSTRMLGADGRLRRDGGDGTLNELDENAVEAAVQIAAATSGEVVALSVGPADAHDAVRRALQLGASRGVVVSDERLVGLDALGTAAVLAAAVTVEGGVDLVLTGMASTDGLTSVVPTALAAYLRLPALALAAHVDVADGTVHVRRELDHAVEELSAPLPAVVSVTDAANEPSFPGFRAIMAARKKPVQELGLDEVVPGLTSLGLDPSMLGGRTRVLHAEPQQPRTDRVLVTDDGDAGVRLAAWLVDQRLV